MEIDLVEANLSMLGDKINGAINSLVEDFEKENGICPNEIGIDRLDVTNIKSTCRSFFFQFRPIITLGR